MFSEQERLLVFLCIFHRYRACTLRCRTYIVHCNLLVCNSNVGTRCFIFSPNLGGFCFSLGGFARRGFVQVGAFVGCLPGTGPVGLTVAVDSSAGAVECRFSMPAASSDPEVLFSESIGRVRLVRRSILFAMDWHRTWRTDITKN